MNIIETLKDQKLLGHFLNDKEDRLRAVSYASQTLWDESIDEEIKKIKTRLKQNGYTEQEITDSVEKEPDDVPLKVEPMKADPALMSFSRWLVSVTK